MQMTKGEISRSYKEARQKAKQIGVLAELNACPKEDIIEILKEAGVYKTSKKTPAKKEEIPKPKKVKVAKKPLNTKETEGSEEEEMIEDFKGTLRVPKELANLITEELDTIEESIKGLEAEKMKIEEALAKRKTEYTLYLNFVKTVKVGTEDRRA